MVESYTTNVSMLVESVMEDELILKRYVIIDYVCHN